MQRVRIAAEATSPEQDSKHVELERVIQEQASLIESLQADKSGIEKSLVSLKSDHERILKENQILRKAVTIQEERRVNSELEAKSFKAHADERIKGLEQIILSLRYHLQAQQSVGNDFMHQRPPDVY
jgi:septal ring factor EnvC (AmiA/AmiB activator)